MKINSTHVSKRISPYYYLLAVIVLFCLASFFLLHLPGTSLSSTSTRDDSLTIASRLFDTRLKSLQEQLASDSEDRKLYFKEVINEVKRDKEGCESCPKCDETVNAVVLSSTSSSTLPQKTDAQKSAIFGMAKGIALQNAYQFVRSIRNHMSEENVDIYLWSDAASVSQELKKVYEDFGVNVVYFNLEEDFRGNARQQAYHPSSYRWILMRRFMLNLEKQSNYAHRGARKKDGTFKAFEREQGVSNVPPYKSVMFVDVRDTVWQDDVFSKAVKLGEGLTAFSEQRPRTIRECGWNSKWVSACFGDEGLNKVGDNVISCSGTVLGTWDDALAYAGLLADLIESRPDCEQNGIDQGIHNYYLFSGDLENAVSKLRIMSNEEGFVVSVQSMPTIRRDRMGRVVNDNGEVVAAVHQYDRSQDLVRQFAKEYTWLETGEMLISK